jgi:hypothetical protein
MSRLGSEELSRAEPEAMQKKIGERNSQHTPFGRREARAFQTDWRRIGAARTH